MEKEKIRSSAEMHEIGVVYKRPVYTEMPVIKCSLDIHVIIKGALKGVCLDYQEHFWSFYFNNSNKLLGFSEISKGDATGTIVNIPQIFAIAIKVSAKSIILVHNHPSGNLKASTSDRVINEKVRNISELFGINLLDNLIITSESYMSFADEGILKVRNDTPPF